MRRRYHPPDEGCNFSDSAALSRPWVRQFGLCKVCWWNRRGSSCFWQIPRLRSSDWQKPTGNNRGFFKSGFIPDTWNGTRTWRVWGVVCIGKPPGQISGEQPPILATTSSLFSVFRDLQSLYFFAPLQIQIASKNVAIVSTMWSKVCNMFRIISVNLTFLIFNERFRWNVIGITRGVVVVVTIFTCLQLLKVNLEIPENRRSAMKCLSVRRPNFSLFSNRFGALIEQSGLRKHGFELTSFVCLIRTAAWMMRFR